MQPRKTVNSEGQLTVLFAIPSLSGGGAERVILWLSERFQKLNYNTHIVTMSSESFDIYPVPDGVNRHALSLTGGSSGKFSAIAINFSRINQLRKTVNAINADVVISFTTTINVLSILACMGTKTVSIVSERSNPTRMKLNKFWQILRKITYRFADVQVAQTERVANWLKENTGNRNVVVIPNPVVYPILSQSKNGESKSDMLSDNCRIILAVGRLISQKGFDSLIRAFSTACKDNSSWHLVILGDGDNYDSLKSLADSTDIGDRIHLVGRCADITSWYNRAEIFVLSSIFEGFPNVLVEAMAHGLAVVSTDCEYGPREIIDEGVNGMLVPVGDETAMSEGLTKLVQEEKLREKLGSNAKKVRDTYSPENVLSKWTTCVFRSCT